MYLDFEKPIAELESKLQDMLVLATETNVDMTKQVKSLETKIVALKKETYSHLPKTLIISFIVWFDDHRLIKLLCYYVKVMEFRAKNDPPT